MPYKSEAQRRYFNANREKLEAEGVDVDEWNESSKGKKLPKKAEKEAFAPDTSFADGYDEGQLREALAERVHMIEQLRAHRDALLDDRVAALARRAAKEKASSDVLDTAFKSEKSALDYLQNYKKQYPKYNWKDHAQNLKAVQAPYEGLSGLLKSFSYLAPGSFGSAKRDAVKNYLMGKNKQYPLPKGSLPWHTRDTGDRTYLGNVGSFEPTKPKPKPAVSKKPAPVPGVSQSSPSPSDMGKGASDVLDTAFQAISAPISAARDAEKERRDKEEKLQKAVDRNVRERMARQIAKQRVPKIGADVSTTVSQNRHPEGVVEGKTMNFDREKLAALVEKLKGRGVCVPVSKPKGITISKKTITVAKPKKKEKKAADLLCHRQRLGIAKLAAEKIAKRELEKRANIKAKISELLKNKAIKGGLIGAGTGLAAGGLAELLLPAEEDESRLKFPAYAGVLGGSVGSLAGALGQGGFFPAAKLPQIPQSGMPNAGIKEMSGMV